MSKKKGKDTVIRRDIVTDDGAEYIYTLYAKESENVASFRLPLYSVRISMTDENGHKTEAAVENVFCDVGKAVVFYDHVMENLATPLNLPYIFEDENC